MKSDTQAKIKDLESKLAKAREALSKLERGLNQHQEPYSAFYRNSAIEKMHQLSREALKEMGE